MKSEEQTIREASKLFKAGQETQALKMLRRVEETTDDKGLRRKLGRVIRNLAAGPPHVPQQIDVELFYRPGRR